MFHKLEVKYTLLEHLVMKRPEHSSRDFRTTFLEFTLDFDLITKVIHLFYNLLGHPLIDGAFLDFLESCQIKWFLFKWILFFDDSFCESYQGLFNMNLNGSKVLVTLIPNYLEKKKAIMIFFDISLCTVNQSNSPLDDEVLETVFLVKICVDVLFHSLLRLTCFSTPFVILFLLVVDVRNHIEKLFQRYYPGGYYA